MSLERHCDTCGCPTTWLRRKEAAAVADVTPHTISVWAKSGALHLLKSPNNRYLICDRSLFGRENETLHRGRRPGPDDGQSGACFTMRL
jgi:hypothetical protein